MSASVTFAQKNWCSACCVRAGIVLGLAHEIPAMEACPSYRPGHDKGGGKTYLRGDTTKCLNYYYFIEEATACAT